MNWRDRSGLSLMELLIALVLVSVIAVGLTASTSFGVQLLDRTQNLQKTSPQLALRMRLRHWMTTAVPPTHPAGFDTTFNGSSRQVSFTTLTPAPFAPQSAALRMIFDASGTDLLLQVDELDNTGAVLQSHNRVLGTNVQNAEINYFSDNPEAPGWRNTWEDEDRLPTLIRITADTGSTPEWPDFIVKPVFAQRN